MQLKGEKRNIEAEKSGTLLLAFGFHPVPMQLSLFPFIFSILFPLKKRGGNVWLSPSGVPLVMFVCITYIVDDMRMTEKVSRKST